MYTHSHAHTVGLTHWGPQWSPWRSTHSWGKSLYETQSPGRWFLCLPQNRTSLWSRALSSPVSTKQERNYKFTLSWQRAAANESVVRFQTVLSYILIWEIMRCDCVCGSCAAHQSFGHGCFVLSGKVLLQSQHNTVGDDGGEDHVLKWSGRLKLRSNWLR